MSDTIFDSKCAVTTGPNGVGKIMSSKPSDGVPIVMLGMVCTEVDGIVHDFVAKCDSKYAEDSAGCAWCEETLNVHHKVVLTCEVTDSLPKKYKALESEC